jgi:hypothetical protein
MFQFFKELYLTWFTIGFRFRAPPQLGGGWGPIMDAGKGVLFVCLMGFFILKGIESYIEIHVGTRFIFDSSLWERAAIILSFYLTNYYVLVIRSYGIKFERVFTHLQKSRKVLLIVTSLVLLLAIIAFCIYSDFVYRRHFSPLGNQ